MATRPRAASTRGRRDFSSARGCKDPAAGGGGKRPAARAGGPPSPDPANGPAEPLTLSLGVAEWPAVSAPFPPVSRG
uniref:Uncharacterized protein n=1 Tax=Rangifer tarandus platyrhynchus TaxID=3082113 RepID=A0ACB0E640_RANTA|nr:unnamed protein product [Rangifer tarandus platyrhynchus]